MAGARSFPSVRIEPAPMKTSVNVPTNSAKPRLSGSWSIAPDGTRRIGRNVLGGLDRLARHAARAHSRECIFDVGEDRERRPEVGQLEDLMHLGVAPVRHEEREAE